MERPQETICNGPSMKPTLKPGDKIETSETPFSELLPGDVIIYDSPENIRINVVHRIIKRDAENLTTRGDNNSHIDPYQVRPEHRPLKVIAIKRGPRHLRLAGGKAGLILHRMRLTQRLLRVFKKNFLHPFYVWIADTGIFYVFGFMLKTEIRKFKRPEGMELQLFSRKRRIGIFKNGKWQLHFPWGLFVNKAKLKENPDLK